MTANLVPNGDLKAVEDLLRRHKDLEFGHKISLSALDEAARKFLLNRHLDNNSPTIGKVRSTLEGLTLRSRSKLTTNIANLPDFVVDMLFGEAPGTTVALAVHHNGGALSKSDGSSVTELLHCDGPVVSEAIKTLWRHGDGTASPSGQVQVRRLNIVGGWVPERATIGELARLLTGIITIIEGSLSSEPARERQLLCMAHRLIVAGSFGSRTLYSSLVSGLTEAEALTGRAAFVSDIIPLVLADFQDRVGEFGGNPARDLTCLLFEEYVTQSSLVDRKQLLALLSECFPETFAHEVRQACDRLRSKWKPSTSQAKMPPAKGARRMLGSNSVATRPSREPETDRTSCGPAIEIRGVATEIVNAPGQGGLLSPNQGFHPMKIWLFSDLHLEFGDLPQTLAIPDADVCVVAGDLCRAPANGVHWLAKTIAPKMPCVYVAGNHEFYKGSVREGIEDGRKRRLHVEFMVTHTSCCSMEMG